MRGWHKIVRLYELPEVATGTSKSSPPTLSLKVVSREKKNTIHDEKEEKMTIRDKKK